MTKAMTPTLPQLNTLVVLGWNQQIWRKTIQLSIVPFPGLGIRAGVYDLLHVDSVVVGDFGYDVTCICTMEGSAENYTESHIRSFGFQEGDYP